MLQCDDHNVIVLTHKMDGHPQWPSSCSYAQTTMDPLAGSGEQCTTLWRTYRSL